MYKHSAADVGECELFTESNGGGVSKRREGLPNPPFFTAVNRVPRGVPTAESLKAGTLTRRREGRRRSYPGTALSWATTTAS